MESLAGKLTACLPEAVSPLRPDSNPVILDTSDPIAFWSGFLGAMESHTALVLLDPAWPEAWRTSLTSRVRNLSRDRLPVEGDDMPVLIPTSGSTGLPKFCVHSTATLAAAATGFTERFSSQLHAVNVLPQNHVGGLMPVLRTALAGGQVHFGDYRDVEALAAGPFPLPQSSLSVVPTQLQRLRTNRGNTAALRQFGAIFIGGAACPDDLLEWARAEELPLCPCYGMTETAAMVSALDPDAFRNGRSGVGQALPHARVSLDADGLVRVTSPANLLAYHPETRDFVRDPLVTGDEGHFDVHGSLHILGRSDRVIITGGKKVQPGLVESAALATGLVAQAQCRGEPDPDWGMRIVLDVTATGEGDPDPNRLLEALSGELPRYALPKEIRILPG